MTAVQQAPQAHQQFAFGRFPKTDRELYSFVRAMWGWTIPWTPVCPNHTTPFQAFADAYFARSPIVIWKASRGFGGKTNTLGLLGQTEAVALSAQVSILGGSGAQSTRVYEAGQEAWQSPSAPKPLLVSQNRYETRFTTGAWIETLMASQRSVRGTHPQRLRMDEIDEMDLAILEASLGTVMEGRRGKQKGIEPHIVMCVVGSTLVLTQRGEVPVTEVTTADRVLTRKGWRNVTASIRSGHAQTFALALSNGRTITCTGNHRIAVPGGWMTPDEMSVGQEVVGASLDLTVSKAGNDDAPFGNLGTAVLHPTTQAAARPALTPTTGHDLRVPVAVGVPAGAVSLGGVDGGRGDTSQHVRLGGDGFQMGRVAAGTVATQVIEREVVGDWADQLQVCKPMHGATVESPVQPPVASGQAPVPDPAGCGHGASNIAGLRQEPVFVIGIGAAGWHDVYDLSVEGVPEFVAEGIVIHNSSTHQYPDKAMSTMLKRAAENDWPVYEWCISGGAVVTTYRGGVLIEDVKPGDRVWTRQGWRSVQHRTLMGTKPTVVLALESGRTLTCTAEHRIAVPGGWTQAGTLTAGSVVLTQADAAVPSPIGAGVGVGVVVGMPAGAHGLAGPSVVSAMDSGVDDFQVVDVDARTHTADVVDLQAGDAVTSQTHDGTVDKGFTPGLSVHDPVAIRLANGPLPDEAAAVGFDCAVEKIVDVSHGAIVPVYDIGVHGAHEFVANGIVVHNCYRECMNPVDGWLGQKEVDTKRTVVPRAMWDAEYDLQEPSFEGRAIDVDAVDYAFSAELGETDQDVWFDSTLPMHGTTHLMHVTGIDWAKERDLTVVATFDTSQQDEPWRCVAWQCWNRIPWPAQVTKAENQYRRFGGYLAHDATGIGNVLADYIDSDLRRRNKNRMYDITLNGQVRATIFTDYISAIEDGMIAYPRIERAWREHKYVTMDDLFGKGHPPDSVVAGAVAWHLRDKLRRGTTPPPQGITRGINPWNLSVETE